MNDLISVIVPMYNTESYIEKTVLSIINQTYQDVEIILINDASTDQTLEIAKAFKKKYQNIVLLEQKVNKGVSAARNLGLKVAKGKYITFVDSDDLLTKHALEKMIYTAKQNDADLVLGIYKNLTLNNISLPGIYKKFISLTQKGRVFTFTNPEIFSHVYIFGKLYKKELLVDNYFPEGISYAEDQPFTMHAYLNAKRIFIVPSVVYYYREREQGDSATQHIIKYPLKNLQSVFDSFEIGKKYFEKGNFDENNYALLLYISRVLQGSIRFIFENVIIINNQIVLQSVIEMLIRWIEGLDDYLVLGTDSFQNVFFENGEIYIKHFDSENQKLYMKLLRLIKDKKLMGTVLYNRKIREKNKIIGSFLNNIDSFLITNKIVINKFRICYPSISQINDFLDEAIIHFQIVCDQNHLLYKAFMFKEMENWIIDEIIIEGQTVQKKISNKEKKPKILLTYRDFSGCNTLALYKSIPPYIDEKFDVEIFPGNQLSAKFTRKIEESDIVVTTNMEYGFNKFGFNPQKVVIDLWHGFPLKNMFFTDPNYRDKDTISSYWKQFDYLLSYSNLYTDVVSDCTKVNPNRFVITGAPRNDFLFKKTSRKKFFQLLKKEDNGQKIVVYMPTFRLTDQKKDFQHIGNIFGLSNFDFIEFKNFLEENNFELIIKAHPIFKRDYQGLIEESSNITLINSEDLMNEYLDFYEILGASEILITDYSSVYFDLLLIDKPIIFVPNDLEEYRKERGFILGSYEQWTPGPKVINQKDLQEQIKDYEKNSQDYQQLRSEIKDKVHFYKDGNSTERVWRFISNLGNELFKTR